MEFVISLRSQGQAPGEFGHLSGRVLVFGDAEVGRMSRTGHWRLAPQDVSISFMGSAILMLGWAPSEQPGMGREPRACCRRPQHRNQLSEYLDCLVLEGGWELLWGKTQRQTVHNTEVSF